MGTEQTLLAGRYELRRRVGNGPLGPIWEGYDRELEQAVTVALPPSGSADDSSQRERLRLAVERAARIEHANVVTVHDAGDGSFVVMDAVRGRSVRRLLDQRGPLPIGAVIELTVGVCSALRAAHAAGVPHGALSLDSLLVGSDMQVQVADFAVAAALLGGTPARYPAPEQTLTGRADDRSDLYALGCCLYEMLTGRPPFERSSSAEVTARYSTIALPPPPRSVRPDVPSSLGSVILKALAVNPTDRYQTPMELRRAIQSARQRGPEQFSPAGSTTAALPDPPRRSTGGRHRPGGSSAPPAVPPAVPPAGPQVRTARHAPLVAALVLAGLLAVALAVAVTTRPDGTDGPVGGSAEPVPTASPSPVEAPTRRATVALPALVGLTHREAVEALNLAGLRVAEVRRVRDERVPAGQVVSSSPPAGIRLPASRAITLVLSDGAGPVSVEDLIAMVDADPDAAGRRGPAFRGRLAELDTLSGSRRRAELADLLGIAKAGATNGDFSAGFSVTAVRVLAPQVGVPELIALIDTDPEATGPRGPTFGGRLADLDTLSGQRREDEVADLLRIAAAGASNGDFTPQFSAAAVDVLRRLA